MDAFDTFLRVPATVTAKGSHVRDAIDIKRVMIIVVLALVPAALFGMWNVGYQHDLAVGDLPGFWRQFWWGFLKVLPLYLVSYIVGLAIEFAGAQIKGEEVNEGYLVSGFLIPLIVPVDVPLWMLAVAVAFYPSKMSGSEVWIAHRCGADAITGATPLTFLGDGMDALGANGYTFWNMFAGTIPGSVGETSVIAILIGAFIILWTGVASWKIMLSSVAGALLVGWIGTLCGVTDIPAYYQLVMGGFAFGTVFMATDPVTSAQTETGKWIYGFLVGALCVTVRFFNPGYAEGMMLAILLMNTFAPLIDHCVTSSATKRRAKKVSIV